MVVSDVSKSGGEMVESVVRKEVEEGSNHREYVAVGDEVEMWSDLALT